MSPALGYAVSVGRARRIQSLRACASMTTQMSDTVQGTRNSPHDERRQKNPPVEAAFAFVRPRPPETRGHTICRAQTYMNVFRGQAVLTHVRMQHAACRMLAHDAHNSQG